MLYLKSCPKCRGDLYLDRDAYGAFRQCLQCGLIQDLLQAGRAQAQGAGYARQPGRVVAKAGSKRAIA